jgi:hypothetical protein
MCGARPQLGPLIAASTVIVWDRAKTRSHHFPRRVRERGCPKLINVHRGILSTPVVDVDSRTLYVVRWSSPESHPAKAIHQLHALKIVDGSHRHPPLPFRCRLATDFETGYPGHVAMRDGFGPLFRTRIAPTIAAPEEVRPRWALPGHCTGWEATHATARELAEAFIASSVGTSLEL